jgi:hypothetical protein
MTAIISDCGTYRYTLTRPATQRNPYKGTALFIMLNPSKADAVLDDHTIRRCRRFAESWDCNGIVVANLYALRSTKPAALWEHHDPVGPENDYYLRKLALEFETVVFAWGTNARPDRVKQVYDIFTKTGRNRQVLCLGTTANGSPRHPLYVKGDTPLIEWKLAA